MVHDNAKRSDRRGCGLDDRTGRGSQPFPGRRGKARLLVAILALFSSSLVFISPSTAAPTQLSRGFAEGSLTVVAAVGNTVHTVWQDRTFFGSLVILYKRSDDGGRSFGSETSLGDGAHPSIAAIGDDVYVTWHRYTAKDSPGAGNREIFAAASGDGGRGFRSNIRLDDDPNDSVDPHVVATQAGAFVAWTDLHGDVYLGHTLRPEDAWTTTRAATHSTRNGLPPSIGADGENVALAWANEDGILVATSLDSGATIAPPVLLPNTPTARGYSPQVAVSEADVHVAWETSPPTGGYGSAMAASARDGAGSFSPPIELGAMGGQSRGPSIVARRGLVAVGWPGVGGVSVSSSSDRGLSFEGPVLAARTGRESFPELATRRDLSDGPRAVFDWSVPDRFGADVEAPIGIVDYRKDPAAVALPATLATTLNGCASTPDGNAFMGFRWRVDDQPVAGVDCTLVQQFTPKTVHRVELTVIQDGSEDTVAHDVVVDDRLVVSIGDSVGSGEGNPDVPGTSYSNDTAQWQNRQCDRTAKAGPALAAARLEAGDPHTSVTFVHLACSGATVVDADVEHGGLLSPYVGINPADGPLLPPQVDQLKALVGTRPLDALLVSIGANDLRFSSALIDCMLYPDCTTGSTKDEFDARVVDIPDHYAQLAVALNGVVPASKVYVNEYFDPTTVESGAWDLRCVIPELTQVVSGLMGLPPDLALQISDTEARWASTYIMATLNGAVRTATSAHGWRYVGGIASQFRGHGYCAADPWVVTLDETFKQQSTRFGAFHPNNAGHRVYGASLAAAVESSWQDDSATAPAAGPGGRPADTLGEVYVAYTADNGRVTAATLQRGSGGLHPSNRRELTSPTTTFSGGQHITATEEGAWVSWTEHTKPGVFTSDAYQAFVNTAASGPPNLAVRTVAMVQAPSDPQALVAGKSTAIQVDIESTFTAPQWVLAHYRVTDWTGDVVLDADTLISVEPGRSSVFLQPPDAPFLPDDGTTITAVVELDPTGQLGESRETDNVGTSPALLVYSSRTIKIVYVPVAGVSCASTGRVADGAKPFLQGALPVPDGALVQALDCGMTLDGAGGGRAGVMSTMNSLDTLARTFGYDEVVGVVPTGWLATNWAPGTLGIAPLPPVNTAPSAGFLVQQGTPPSAVAHELAHTFGQDHTAKLPAPGYWPAARAEQRGTDLMNEKVVPTPWFSRAVFQYLWLRFRATPGDPAVLVVRGVIHGDDTVSAGPWIRQEGLLDAPLDATGALTLDYVDALGDVLGSVGFDASAASTDADPPTPDRMFSVRVPDLLEGTASLVLREGADVLLTRVVSSASPTVAFTAPLAGATYSAGQPITASITAADGDDDPLSHTYAVSSDGGTTWRPLALDVTGSSFTFTSADDQVGSDVRLRVMTTDGVNTAIADSPSFTITPRPTVASRVVYARTSDDAVEHYRIWTMRPDGTDHQPVPLPVYLVPAFPNTGYITYREPVYSPDGTQIALAQERRADAGEHIARPEVAVVNPDGSGLRRVTETPSVDGWMYQCPAWSPDGTQIAFLAVGFSSATGGGSSIMIVNADGTGQRRVLRLEDNGLAGHDGTPDHSSEVCPRWSPDGLRLAFGAFRGRSTDRDPSVYVIGADGTGLTRILDVPDPGYAVSSLGIEGGVDWSPDGTRMTGAFLADGTLKTFRTDGTDVQTVWTPTFDSGTASRAHYSPDGTLLYFTLRGTGDHLNQMAFIELDGEGLQTISAPADAFSASPDILWPDWVAPPSLEPPPPPPAPDADAGGPYTTPEDAPLLLSAGRSALAVEETPLVEWDLDGDGEFDDASGLDPEVTFADAGTVGARVRISTFAGLTAISEVATVAVLAAPPKLEAAPPLTVVAGEDVAAALAAVDDPGTGVHVATVDWGDGGLGPAVVDGGAGDALPGVRATHRYDDPGSVIVTVTVCDAPPAADACANASIAVTVLAVAPTNAAPVAEDLSVRTDVDTPVLIPVAASDADGNPVTFRLGAAPTHGRADPRPDGSIVYVPDEAFTGLDGFTYIADDGRAVSAPAQVSVQVGPVLATAVGDVLEIAAGVATDIDAAVLLANDFDTESRSIGLAGVYADDASPLAVERVDDSTVLRLTPDIGFTGVTTFSYGIAAGPGTFASAQVRVTVVAAGPAPAVDAAPPLTIGGDAPRSESNGYRMVAADGGVFTFGNRNFQGSLGDRTLNQPIVGGANNPATFDGYWMVASDGGVFTFGDAGFYGSLAGSSLGSPIVEIEPTPSGMGYFLVDAAGRVFPFGDAAAGIADARAIILNRAVIGMTVTRSGLGYWLIASDGGVFSFGDALFSGSMGGTKLNAPIIDLAVAPDGTGYYLLGGDGGVFTFGTAAFKGSTGDMVLNEPAVALLVGSDNEGYWIFASDGGVFTFGGLPFFGAMGDTRLKAPILDAIY